MTIPPLRPPSLPTPLAPPSPPPPRHSSLPHAARLAEYAVVLIRRWLSLVWLYCLHLKLLSPL
ncbi:hypothetical protein PsYK624_151600 [Phanerochaete sordida]|uniref:Uncharacterized protein n=1 Tax=Phanerochaete sordida TaxID=48140 RepID=A0A9P3LKS6_9APHY|nr:hypothetical protein PsYK624_151600 [Phanerochaete sordida]